MKKNKGYTLIEMLIVIAIMAILAGVAVVTIGIIKNARCTAAVNSFQNQVSSLWIKTKAISQGSVQASPTGKDASDKYPLCMRILKNSDSGDDVKDGAYELILGYNTGSGFEEKETVAVLTDIININYTPVGDQHTLNTYDGNNITSAIIQFNKSDGSVVYGAGTYNIMYNNRTFGSIHIDRISGNHYMK